MSSLAAARADNFYYPQEWRPEMGSINKFQKSHPLGKRAKDIAQGVLVVRFEMSFNVWCTHCETHIGRGVRFNAKKKAAGKYFTTTIYEFQLTCTHCQGEMVVRTDPEHRGYEMVSGIRQKVETFEQEDVETERVNDRELAMGIQENAFARIEHENEDKRVASERAKGLQALLELQETQAKDDYDVNAGLRAQFRRQKKQIRKREEEASRMGLGIPLLDVHPEDRAHAKAMVFQNVPNKMKEPLRRSSHPHTDRALVLGGSRGGDSDHRTSRPIVIVSNSSSGKNRSMSSASTGSTKGKTLVEDPFQHFGDPMASRLQQLKRAKRVHVAKPTMLSRDDAARRVASKKRRRVA